MRFKERVAVITGAAQGIGKEIALAFAREGAEVIIFDLFEEKMSETVKELRAHSRAEFFKVDVTDLSEVEKNVNKVIDNFKRVDILVNNAGVIRDSLFLRLSENDWDKVCTVNLKGTFNCVKPVVRHMVKARSGRIINISSVIGIVGNSGQANYAASKAGIIGLTKSLAKELGVRKITVNAIAPGYITTAMTEKLDRKIKEEMLRRIPLARFGTPADVARAVLFLASPDADYITGQVLVVDGGLI